MEKQIIDMLMKMQLSIDEVNNKVDGIQEQVSNINEEVTGLKQEVNSIKKEMNERFDVVDIRLHCIEGKIMQVNRKLDGTTDQVVRNIEQLELLKNRI
ncbi:hypothetical protein QOZ84_05190 [Romboutsia sedimentorum]|jgi:uncharacterized protein YoxC|uniref:Uncharacterized protein n=1 Tax=Romboutsia sedimentorum TaxID=1368474 RepID=A0ABT7E7Q2_9FIRM|nr:hypothetical protein [Romboutsia sedimentorum]MDK2562931.1 hypothetical protein [Romboutsia sedimentorum]MDK2586361.1 hypothetical protein [Romboutsia sedimentorum]